MYSVTEIAYLAGIIDGEGSFSIAKAAQNHPEFGSHYIAQCNIINTNKDLIDWIVNKFGGHIYLRKKVKDFHKDNYALRIITKDLENIITLTLPYLIVKRQHAEVIIRFRKTFDGKRNNLTAEIYNVRSECFQQLKHLNSIG